MTSFHAILFASLLRNLPMPALLLLQVGHGDEALAVFHDMLGPGSAARPTGEAGLSAGSVLAWLRGWQVD